MNRLKERRMRAVEFPPQMVREALMDYAANDGIDLGDIEWMVYAEDGTLLEVSLELRPADESR